MGSLYISPDMSVTGVGLAHAFGAMHLEMSCILGTSQLTNTPSGLTSVG